MKKTCEYCGCEFSTLHNKARYCGRDCARNARRKATFLAHEAKAAELGITVDELRRRIRRGVESRSRYKNGRLIYNMKSPKTYAEIKAANKKHPIAAGWRGQPVMGGGAGVRRNDPWLSINELPRCPGVVSESGREANRLRRDRRARRNTND